MLTRQDANRAEKVSLELIISKLESLFHVQLEMKEAELIQQGRGARIKKSPRCFQIAVSND